MADEYHTLPNGYLLEEYEVIRTLGVGGFGVTYLCRDRNLSKYFAIKEYFPGELAVRKGDTTVVAKSESARKDFTWGLERFVDEARVLAKFNHPNIVRVSRFFLAHNTAYIVMDYVEGEPLSDFLRREAPLDEAEMRAILIPLMEGLEEVHQAKLLHRDIKPDNIMLRPDGSPVLLDFGAARTSVGNDKTRTAMLTPGFAPIEQYSEKSNQGPWTDIYALGAVCYRAILNEDPPYATDRSLSDTIRKLSEAGFEGWSPALLEAIDAALLFRPDQRPADLEAWWALMENTDAAASGHTPETPVAPDPQPGAKQGQKPIRKAKTGSGLRSAGFIAAAMVAVLLFWGPAMNWLGGTETGDSPGRGTDNPGLVEPTIEIAEAGDSPESGAAPTDEAAEQDRPARDEPALPQDMPPPTRPNTGEPAADELAPEGWQVAYGVDMLDAANQYQAALANLQNWGEPLDDNETAFSISQAVDGAEKNCEKPDGAFIFGPEPVCFCDSYYYDSQVLLSSYTKALSWMRLAAKQGHTAAQCSLGYMYWREMAGTNENPAETIKWLKASAKNGSTAAAFYLGRMYEEGDHEDVEDEVEATPDYDEALNWFYKAAVHDDSEAQFSIAKLYERDYVQSDLGVNDLQAYMWYRIAAESVAEKEYSEYTEEERRAGRVAAVILPDPGGLTAGQIREAEKMARNWRRNNVLTQDL